MAELEILNIVNEESRNKLGNKCCLQNDESISQPRPPKIGTKPTASPTLYKNDENKELNIDLTEINVPIPLEEMTMIPSQRNKLKELFDLQDEPEDLLSHDLYLCKSLHKIPNLV
jgi:hypothetical protein